MLFFVLAEMVNIKGRGGKKKLEEGLFLLLTIHPKSVQILCFKVLNAKCSSIIVSFSTVLGYIWSIRYIQIHFYDHRSARFKFQLPHRRQRKRKIFCAIRARGPETNMILRGLSRLVITQNLINRADNLSFRAWPGQFFVDVSVETKVGVHEMVGFEL